MTKAKAIFLVLELTSTEMILSAVQVYMKCLLWAFFFFFFLGAESSAGTRQTKSLISGTLHSIRSHTGKSTDQLLFTISLITQSEEGFKGNQMVQC